MDKLLNCLGRINRFQFLVRSLILLLFEIIVVIVFDGDLDLILILSFAILLVYQVQCAQRYHDLNWPGSVGFYWFLIPIVHFECFYHLYFVKGSDGINHYGYPVILRHIKSNIKR